MRTFGAAYINLLKTSIGSGVLNFPFLFKTYGIVPTIILTVVSGMFAAAGLVILTICSRDIGRSSDLSKLSRLSIPHARIFVDFAVFTKCFGVSISYVIITRQLLPAFIETVMQRQSFWSQPHICLFLFLSIIGPFAFLIKLDRLKYTSFVGIACILVVIAAAAFRYSRKTVDDVVVHMAAPVSLAWLGGLGKFIFSFTCHQNIFAVNAELEDNSIPRMRRLIYLVASTAFVLYMSFGITNYLLYGDGVSDNVLKNYPQDYLATIVRGLYVVVMGVSYPLQVAPARSYFLNMINIDQKSRKLNFMHFFVTSMIIIATYLIAVLGIQLGIVYTLVGATASTFMSLILPALFYFNLEVERTALLSAVAYCAFLFGVFTFAATLLSVLFGAAVH